MGRTYYVLHTMDKNLLDNYYADLVFNRKNVKKRLDYTKGLILIEKQENKKTDVGITNIWTIELGVLSLWKDLVKKNCEVYDYTGVVNPLVHVNDKVYFFPDYCDLLAGKNRKNKK